MYKPKQILPRDMEYEGYQGKEVGEIVGFVPENVLKKRIEEISKNAPGCLSNTSIRR